MWSVITTLLITTSVFDIFSLTNWFSHLLTCKIHCGGNFRFSRDGFWDELSKQKQNRPEKGRQVRNLCWSKRPIRSVYRISLEFFPVDPIYKKLVSILFFSRVFLIFFFLYLAVFIEETSNPCEINCIPHSQQRSF